MRQRERHHPPDDRQELPQPAAADVGGGEAEEAAAEGAVDELRLQRHDVLQQPVAASGGERVEAERPTPMEATSWTAPEPSASWATNTAPRSGTSRSLL